MNPPSHVRYPVNGHLGSREQIKLVPARRIQRDFQGDITDARYTRALRSVAGRIRTRFRPQLRRRTPRPGRHQQARDDAAAPDLDRPMPGAAAARRSQGRLPVPAVGSTGRHPCATHGLAAAGYGCHRDWSSPAKADVRPQADAHHTITLRNRHGANAQVSSSLLMHCSSRAPNAHLDLFPT